jgi:hypothetical protein
MKLGISISIDVTKILKERLYQGKKGTYLDVTTFIETANADQYGNHGFVSQSQTQEERQSGATKTPILGNCKVFYQGDSDEQRKQGYDNGIVEANKAAQTTVAAPSDYVNFDDLSSEVPF